MARRDEYEADLAGDIVQTVRAKQTSFDASNSQQYLRPQQAAQQTPAGPVGRAAQQITPAASQGPAQSLMSINPMPSRSTQPQQAAGLSSVSPAAPAERQTSFDQTNSARYLGSGAGQGSAPEARRASNFTGSLSDFPVGPTTPFRGTGVGQGANQIAMRMDNGVPEFSNQQPAREQATSLGNAQVRPAVQQLDPNTNSLESLGSVRNIGDGVGTFSQSQAGDAALAMGRFDRASQIRQGTRDQQRLDRAIADKYANDHTTVVRDSSRIPTTRVEVRAEERATARDETARQASLDNIGVAQGLRSGTQAQQAGAQQLRQAARLEDIQVRAFAPDATQADRSRYLQASDPAAYLKAQQTNATSALRNEKTQLEIDGIRTDQQQKAADRSLAKESAAATFDQALSSIDTLAGVPGDKSRPEHPGLKETFGTFNSLMPTRPGSDSADFQARLDTLRAQTFLPQVAALKGTGALSDAEGKKLSDSVGALSTKMSENEFRKSLAEVRQTLQSARERGLKGAVPEQATPSTARRAPAAGQVEQGYQFTGGDPASPSSWRKI
jgi:hypothetical protein